MLFHGPHATGMCVRCSRVTETLGKLHLSISPMTVSRILSEESNRINYNMRCNAVLLPTSKCIYHLFFASYKFYQIPFLKN